MSGYTKTCKQCGVAVYETYPGAHTETSELGEDYCDDCESVEIHRRWQKAHNQGQYRRAAELS